MKKTLLSLLILGAIAPAAVASVSPRELVLDASYVRPDGAIITIAGSTMVDPYFPTKALMLAQDNGVDVTKLATGWIHWMLARQDAGGLFSRYCFKNDSDAYEACLAADADDSMMAMWIELLYRMAPAGGMPEEWKKSVANAEYQLFSIYNQKQAIYYVSKTMQAGLLMDNIEVYSAFKRIEKEAKRLRDNKKASGYHSMAEILKTGIISTFWDPKNKRFLASTQTRPDQSFYPDTVVQVFPMFHHFYAPDFPPQAKLYHDWMKDHRQEWFQKIGNDYPWGMLAVLAETYHDEKTADCWLKQVTPYRNVSFWTVLDETAFQILQWKLEKIDRADADCSKESL